MNSSHPEETASRAAGKASAQRCTKGSGPVPGGSGDLIRSRWVQGGSWRARARGPHGGTTVQSENAPSRCLKCPSSSCSFLKVIEASSAVCTTSLGVLLGVSSRSWSSPKGLETHLGHLHCLTPLPGPSDLPCGQPDIPSLKCPVSPRPLEKGRPEPHGPATHRPSTPQAVLSPGLSHCHQRLLLLCPYPATPVLPSRCRLTSSRQPARSPQVFVRGTPRV